MKLDRSRIKCYWLEINHEPEKFVCDDGEDVLDGEKADPYTDRRRGYRALHPEDQYECNHLQWVNI